MMRVEYILSIFFFKQRTAYEMESRGWSSDVCSSVLVTEPTDWVYSIVAAQKKGKQEIRLCITPKDLNTALKRPHHPVCSVEEAASRMPEIFKVDNIQRSIWALQRSEERRVGKECVCTCRPRWPQRQL